MIDSLLLVGASKLALSVGLGLMALLVQRRAGRPAVSHVVWALVLLTLLLPSLYTLPLPGLPAGTSAVMLPVGSNADPVAAGPTAGALPWADLIKFALIAAWLAGTAFVVIWSLARTIRFDRLLRGASVPAGQDMRRLAADLARRMGLRASPPIHVTGAHVSPMVWWTGGVVRVVLPSALATNLSPTQLRCVLAHELAHVRRRDHVTRWLEWLACAAFWWNPVVWLARRQLRVAGELCCDALVLSTLGPSPRTYGGALVTVIDFLSNPAARPAPAFASSVDSGGRVSLIERRLQMIMGKAIPTTPRWLRIALAVTAVCVLPLGLVYCGPEQAVAPEETAAVEQAPAPPAPVQAIGVTDENGETYLTDVDPPLPPVKSERALEELQAAQRLFERARSEQISGGLVRKRIGSQSELPPELQAESERVRVAIASGDLSKQEAEVVLRRLEATIAETRAQDGTQIRELSGTPQRPGIQAQVGPAFLKMRASDPPGSPLDVTELTPEALAALQEAKAQVSRDIEAGSLSPEEGRVLLEKVLRQLKSGG